MKHQNSQTDLLFTFFSQYNILYTVMHILYMDYTYIIHHHQYSSKQMKHQIFQEFSHKQLDRFTIYFFQPIYIDYTLSYAYYNTWFICILYIILVVTKTNETSNFGGSSLQQLDRFVVSFFQPIYIDYMLSYAYYNTWIYIYYILSQQSSKQRKHQLFKNLHTNSQTDLHFVISTQYT